MTRPSLTRLTAVELRKMVDTRAGFWLLVVIALIAAALVTVVLLAAPDEEQTLGSLLTGTLGAVSILLPVLGILAVTSEWSQRTALTTFTLVPRRERVVAAKLLAGVVLALAASMVCLLAALVGSAISGDGSDFGPGALGSGVLYQVLGMLGGLAFGLALMSSALAIVLYFVLPTVFAILGEAITSLNSTFDWLDTSRTMSPLVEGEMAGGDWARLATSLCLWLLLPLVIGLVRLHRRELA